MDTGVFDFLEELSNSYERKGEISRRVQSESDKVSSCVERVTCSSAGLSTLLVSLPSPLPCLKYA